MSQKPLIALRVALFVLCLVVAGAVSGCGDPCQRLAESACEISGTESEACKKVREMAASVSPEEREACDTALGLVKSLERPR